MKMSSEKLFSTLKRRLARSKDKGIYFAIEISQCSEGVYRRVIRAYKATANKKKLNYVAELDSFEDITKSVAKILHYAAENKWNNVSVRFNMVSISQYNADIARENNLKLTFTTSEADTIAKGLFDANVDSEMLKAVWFGKMPSDSLNTAFDYISMQHNDAFTDIKTGKNASNPTEEVKRFIEKNNIQSINNRFDESALCIATTLAWNYYQSEDAVKWLFERFGQQTVLLSQYDDIASSLLSSIEHQLETSINSLALCGSRWLMKRDEDTRYAVIYHKNSDALHPFTQAYVDAYIEDKSIDLNKMDEGKSLFLFIQNLALYGKPSGSQFHYESLNLLNLNLIKYLFSEKISGITMDWMDDFLNYPKRAESFLVKNILKSPAEITDLANSYNDIREYGLSVVPNTVKTVDHFNPLRMALIQSISSRERDVSMSNKHLRKFTKQEVGKALIYTDDVIAFIKYYDINPVEAMEYLGDPELQGFCMTLISQ